MNGVVKMNLLTFFDSSQSPSLAENVFVSIVPTLDRLCKKTHKRLRLMLEVRFDVHMCGSV
jgi:hypothetical protein